MGWDSKDIKDTLPKKTRSEKIRKVSYKILIILDGLFQRLSYVLYGLGGGYIFEYLCKVYWRFREDIVREALQRKEALSKPTFPLFRYVGRDGQWYQWVGFQDEAFWWREEPYDAVETKQAPSSPTQEGHPKRHSVLKRLTGKLFTMTPALVKWMSLGWLLSFVIVQMLAMCWTVCMWFSLILIPFDFHGKESFEPLLFFLVTGSVLWVCCYVALPLEDNLSRHILWLYLNRKLCYPLNYLISCYKWVTERGHENMVFNIQEACRLFKRSYVPTGKEIVVGLLQHSLQEKLQASSVELTKEERVALVEFLKEDYFNTPQIAQVLCRLVFELCVAAECTEALEALERLSRGEGWLKRWIVSEDCLIRETGQELKELAASSVRQLRAVQQRHLLVKEYLRPAEGTPLDLLRPVGFGGEELLRGASLAEESQAEPFQSGEAEEKEQKLEEKK
ncbi:hypothetical protein CTKA_00355 [Chthonomonas calidirosea]|uniref:Uncharacterized protein n=1 Tax=Chthonomonas calidirosea (strain DSM 23976 / ICMP 18418 / T49) TaxID=1303518 RepID=S0ETS2_CHTCT|nr:hypothetical protein CCALI_00800 [Chthonomonas calidirosea T49]CEK14248.1 hypothetical protein CTKA_00355 [Chthonomonas calidirosea]